MKTLTYISVDDAGKKSKKKGRMKINDKPKADDATLNLRSLCCLAAITGTVMFFVGASERAILYLFILLIAGIAYFDSKRC